MAIQASSQKAYCAIKAALEGGQFEHHVVNRQEKRSKRFIIRNLPVSTEPDDIEFDLSVQGVDVSFVNRKPKPNPKGDHDKLYPSFVIEVPPEVPKDKVLGISHVCHMRVKVEEEAYKGPPICGRCQGFRHGKGGCANNPKCGLCTGSHLTDDCPSPPAEPTCANCKQVGHRPTFKGCPTYQKWLKGRQQRQEVISTGQAQPQPVANAWIKPPAIIPSTTPKVQAQPQAGHKATPKPKAGPVPHATTSPSALEGLDFNLTTVINIIKQVVHIFKVFKTQGLLAALPLLEGLLDQF